MEEKVIRGFTFFCFANRACEIVVVREVVKKGPISRHYMYSSYSKVQLISTAREGWRMQLQDPHCYFFVSIFTLEVVFASIRIESYVFYRNRMFALALVQPHRICALLDMSFPMIMLHKNNPLSHIVDTHSCTCTSKALSIGQRILDLVTG